MPAGLRTLIEPPRLAARIAELGAALGQRYSALADDPEAELVVVPLLGGAFCFAADLVRCIPLLELRLHFSTASSYHGGTESSGAVSLSQIPDCQGQHVLILDDILDTGRTLAAVTEAIQAQQPASLASCVLLDKPARRQLPIQADFVGFEIPDLFVVGYGLDYQERYRHLPAVCVLDPEHPGDQGLPSASDAESVRPPGG